MVDLTVEARSATEVEDIFRNLEQQLQLEMIVGSPYAQPVSSALFEISGYNKERFHSVLRDTLNSVFTTEPLIVEASIVESKGETNTIKRFNDLTTLLKGVRDDTYSEVMHSSMELAAAPSVSRRG